MQEYKRQVLIVDDEFRIGMLIKKLVHWEEFGLECLSVTDDPQHALELIRERKPDIVITDIRMPRITGLDLVRMAREGNEEIKFIIVSGYKDFEYAHKALQYEVDGYLLKPINEDELNELLRKVTGKIDRETEQITRTREMEQTISESRQIINRNFLKRILEQEDTGTADDAEGVSLTGDVYQGLDVKLDYTDFEHADQKQDEITVKRVTQIIENGLKDAASETLICEKEDLHIYVLLSYAEASAKKVRMCVNRILSDIQEYLLKFEQYEVTVGVGTERRSFADIRFSIREANRAVGNRLRQGTGRLIFANTLPAERKEQLLTDGLSEEFGSAVETFDIERTEHCINRIFAGFSGDDCDCSQCYDVVDELLDILLTRTSAQTEEMETTRARISHLSQHCGSMTRLRQFLKTEFGGYLESIREAVESESIRPIRQAKEYISEHYAEKIVLEDIAEIVGLNPVYFSVLFKNKTDMNFSAYLVHVRMEKAKEMLVETNETIAAIADRVGYKDSRYFSQIFTKMVGVKPALYRRLHS